MQLDWLWTSLLTIVVSVVTVLATQGVQSILVRYRVRDKHKQFLADNAFSLTLQYGNIWYVEKLDSPPAQDFRYHIVDRRLGQRTPHTKPIEVLPGGRYGIRDIEIRDTVEAYWTESGRQFSTSVVIHDEREIYYLKRENTGH